MRSVLLPHETIFVSSTSSPTFSPRETVSASSFDQLKEQVMSTLTELKTTDYERKQLELKAEHERQLIGLERKCVAPGGVRWGEEPIIDFEIPL